VVDAAVERDVVAAGCELKQLVAAEHPARLAGERLEQAALAGSEAMAAAVDRAAMSCPILRRSLPFGWPSLPGDGSGPRG
jgi:hypothetical protein